MKYFGTTPACLSLLIMAAAFSASCGNGEREETPPAMGSSDSSATRISDSTAAARDLDLQLATDDSLLKAAPRLDACEIARHVTSSLDTITRWSIAVHRHQDDGCVLAIVDSLVEGFDRTGNEAYLVAFDSIGSHSDGYLSEALWISADSVFRARPVGVVRYLHERRSERPFLRWALTGEWTMRLEGSADSNRSRQTLLAELRRVLPVDSLRSDERSYVDELMREARLIR